MCVCARVCMVGSCRCTRVHVSLIVVSCGRYCIVCVQ